MENQLQTTELLLTIANNTTTILQKLEDMEVKISDIKPKINDFNISTYKKASKIARCSITILRKAIQNNTLKKDIHYRTNGKRKYLFSNNALENIKGTL